MIKSVRVINWKSYEDSILYIDPLTILIGTNASGKSNVVDGLIFLSRIAKGVGIYQAINGDMAIKALRGGVDWVCRQGHDIFSIETIVEIEGIEYLYDISVKVKPAAAQIIQERLVKKGKKDIENFHTELIDENDSNIPVTYWTNGKGQDIDLSRNTSILAQSRSLGLKKAEIIEAVNAIVDMLGGIFVLDPIPNHMRDYSQISDQLASDASNIAGVLASFDEKKKNEIEKTICSYLKKVPEKDIQRVWAERVGKFNTDAMIYCSEGWSEDSECVVDAKGMSDGTLRYLAIIAAMLTNDHIQLLVIEEVDNGLHPSRAKNLLEMLKELGKQRGIDVVITTHNPALLGAAGTKMIPFITVAHRGQKGQSKLTLLEDIKDLPKLISIGDIGALSTEGRIEAALSRKEGEL